MKKIEQSKAYLNKEFVVRCTAEHIQPPPYIEPTFKGKIDAKYTSKSKRINGLTAFERIAVPNRFIFMSSDCANESKRDNKKTSGKNSESINLVPSVIQAYQAYNITYPTK